MHRLGQLDAFHCEQKAQDGEGKLWGALQQERWWLQSAQTSCGIKLVMIHLLFLGSTVFWNYAWYDLGDGNRCTGNADWIQFTAGINIRTLVFVFLNYNFRFSKTFFLINLLINALATLCYRVICEFNFIENGLITNKNIFMYKIPACKIPLPLLLTSWRKQSDKTFSEWVLW